MMGSSMQLVMFGCHLPANEEWGFFHMSIRYPSTYTAPLLQTLKIFYSQFASQQSCFDKNYFNEMTILHPSGRVIVVFVVSPLLPR